MENITAPEGPGILLRLRGRSPVSTQKAVADTALQTTLRQILDHWRRYRSFPGEQERAVKRFPKAYPSDMNTWIPSAIRPLHPICAGLESLHVYIAGLTCKLRS